MTSEHPGGLLQPAETGTWTADELREAMRRIDALARELTALEHGLQSQHSELSQLQDTVRTVDGRTQRHEHAQLAAREVLDAIAQVEERLEAESALRRDLAAFVERQQEREARLQSELQRVIDTVAARIDEFASREAATADRQRSLLQEMAQYDRDDLDVGGRLEALESQIAGLREADQHAGRDVARVASALQPLLSTIESLESRTRAIQADQRRIDDDVAALRAVRDREDALLEVLEQQRATRARLEARVSQLEAAIEGMRVGHTQEDESVALLRRQLATEAEQRRALADRVEAQREVLIQYLRRQQRAEEEHVRRQVDELQRQARTDRTLLARLEEEAGDAEQEQPL